MKGESDVFAIGYLGTDEVRWLLGVLKRVNPRRLQNARLIRRKRGGRTLCSSCNRRRNQQQGGNTDALHNGRRGLEISNGRGHRLFGKAKPSKWRWQSLYPAGCQQLILPWTAATGWGGLAIDCVANRRLHLQPDYEDGSFHQQEWPNTGGWASEVSLFFLLEPGPARYSGSLKSGTSIPRAVAKAI